jgi:dephospho-CoA kinase
MVYYADEIARELSDSIPAIRRAMVQLLGEEAYSPDGKLNRPYVASLVFSKRHLQRQLNAIVHPYVKQELERRVAQYGGRLPFVLIEAALIYEAGLETMLDAVIVVDAEQEVRLRRVVERDHVRPEEVRKRMKAQWSQQKKLQRADYIITNNGSLQELETSVRFLFNLFLQRYREGNP